MLRHEAFAAWIDARTAPGEALSSALYADYRAYLQAGVDAGNAALRCFYGRREWARHMELSGIGRKRGRNGARMYCLALR